MKKIMFNDRYGLTQAVLDGRKTMTRRIIKGEFEKVTAYHANGGWCFLADTKDGETIVLKPQYLECEKVAVAQSYSNAYDVLRNKCGKKVADDWGCNVFNTLGSIPPLDKRAGWTNKMFVCAELMPHRIRITDIKVERLQNISHKDCLKEGITTITEGKKEVGNGFGWDTMADTLERDTFFTAKAAFAALIDRISGKGTWERNPWVYAYEFELIK